ncbi:baculoviral IAP repeat-containing protein 2-like [Penaeus indicus]|uniref:baculoviral IAP repeat-containing protein 2-like n=1 Tax=Penaeus indicus TaxID=29960 RepID=UPI00300C4B8E
MLAEYLSHSYSEVEVRPNCETNTIPVPDQCNRRTRIYHIRNSFLQQEEYRLTTFSEHEISPIDTTIVYRDMPGKPTGNVSHCSRQYLSQVTGSRNWISSDIPWKEHARWYPKCRFVLLKKGQDYINEVQREYSPYTRTASTVYSGIDKAASGSKPCLEDVIQRMSVTENRVADNRSESTEREPSYDEQMKEELERMREDRTCKVCMDSEIAIVFLPCSHMVTCVSCAVSLRQCPICRRDIKHVCRAIVS